jgi:hypothetical protein
VAEWQISSDSGPNGRDHHHSTSDEWFEMLTRTVAHLAAQLAMTQMRLRALATVLEECGAVDASAVRAHLRTIAAQETGTYLRENLGEALCKIIDVERLEADIREFLS